MTLSPELQRELEALRQAGYQVIGPGPVRPGQSPPTPGAPVAMPGAHVQIGDGTRLIEGLGGTADEAVRDALAKLRHDPH